jgi:alcohol dehydrogenase class IV
VAESSVIALAHAAGAILSEPHSPLIEGYAHSALQYLAQYMVKGVKKPGNKEASMALNNAYAMAAIAFSNAPAGMVHLLADELSRATEISAGILMRILLPYTLAHMLHKKTRIKDELYLALAGFDAYSAKPAKERSVAGVEKALELLKCLDGILPSTMKELKIPKYKLGEIAKAAAARSDKRYSEADCSTILEHAWEGKSF